MTMNMTENPLLQNWTYPPFDAIEYNHYLPAFQQSIKEAKQELDVIAGNPQTPSFANTIAAIDQAGMQYNKVANVFFNLLETDATSQMQAIAEQVIPLTVDYSNYYYLHTELFARVKYVYEHIEKQMLSTEESALLEKIYKDYVRHGIMLGKEEQNRYKAISEKLSEITMRYKNNVLSDTAKYELYFSPDQAKDLSGIPASEMSIAADRALKKNHEGGWLFDLSMPGYTAFMKYADNRTYRRQLYMAYNARALGGENDNRDLVRQIVNLRLESARLLGYGTYADYVLENRMATTPQEVNDFLNRLNKAFKPIAEQECITIQKYANEHGLQGELQPWDWAYYSTLYQTSLFSFDEQLLKPYFRLEQVQKGVFELANRLYGLEFERNTQIPIYAPEVQVWNVYQNDHTLLAVLFMDFYPRATKRNGAWMTSFVDTYKNEQGERVIPQISLVFNFTPATAECPSLLSYNEVTTFLHEFGHALHGMLSQVNYLTLSGTSVKRDFVELPSQIMENWACEQEFLQLFAYHYQNGDALPRDWVEKIKMIDNYCAGYDNVRQFNFAVLDMAWHSITQPLEEDVEKFELNATQHTTLLPRVQDTAISTAFTHIFGGGYAAGYYGYKWAEVLAADAFEEFKQHGIFSKEVAERFKNCILTKGGTEHPMNLYIKFKGRKPNVEALLRKSLG